VSWYIINHATASSDVHSRVHWGLVKYCYTGQQVPMVGVDRGGLYREENSARCDQWYSTTCAVGCDHVDLADDIAT
jgi:hypothetical protein